MRIPLFSRISEFRLVGQNYKRIITLPLYEIYKPDSYKIKFNKDNIIIEYEVKPITTEKTIFNERKET